MTAVADLLPAEAAELGPLLQQASWVASRLVDAEQVYNCLWSHAGGVLVHIHYVVQPVISQQISSCESYGPDLQVALFEAGIVPDPAEVAEVADRARRLFAVGRHAGSNRRPDERSGGA